MLVYKKKKTPLEQQCLSKIIFMHHVTLPRVTLHTPTMRSRASLLLWAALLGVSVGGVSGKGTRVWLDDSGAYRDLVVAVHPAFIPANCTSFFANLKVRLYACRPF